MPLLYFKTVNYVLTQTVNYVIILYSLLLPCDIVYKKKRIPRTKLLRYPFLYAPQASSIGPDPYAPGPWPLFLYKTIYIFKSCLDGILTVLKSFKL